MVDCSFKLSCEHGTQLQLLFESSYSWYGKSFYTSILTLSLKCLNASEYPVTMYRYWRYFRFACYSSPFYPSIPILLDKVVSHIRATMWDILWVWGKMLYYPPSLRCCETRRTNERNERITCVNINVVVQARRIRLYQSSFPPSFPPPPLSLSLSLSFAVSSSLYFSRYLPPNNKIRTNFR